MRSIVSVNRWGQQEEIRLDLFRCFALGYTGRDQTAVQAHIEELAKHGIAAPRAIPACYPIRSQLVTTDHADAQVYGESTSGEIEPVLITFGGNLRYVTVGSDHTDREVERSSVALSKQLCPKFIASLAWPAEEVLPHWDRLGLQSSLDGTPYQSACLRDFLVPDALIEAIPASLTETTVIFAGTVAAIGGIRVGRNFAGALHDPVLGRSISFEYTIDVLEPLS